MSVAAMSIKDKLTQLRSYGGAVRTSGLSDNIIAKFAELDPKLEVAVDSALSESEVIAQEYPDFMGLDEHEQMRLVQADYVNFYAQDAINPYVSLGANGPWVVTSKGAVLHDSGGYGMLGFGHAPERVLEAMNRPHVMANVMTPNVSQMRLSQALLAEIGHSRGGCPYARFLCLNSGSESVTIASRISDINAKLMTDPGGRHEGKPIKKLAIKGAFHGRTDRPAQYSDSTLPNYEAHLASFRNRDDLITVAANNINELKAAFARADSESFFIESMFMEPVMGEGDPGMAVLPEFYAVARELTTAHGALLLMDSIQAGLRAWGSLSVVDYPGFEKLTAPDMETYSKALNAGQYPLSVLAVTESTAQLYCKGVYGNTMTTNPRAMDVAVAVLESVTPQLRKNIVDKGAEFLQKFEALKDELGGAITKVQGTGLLFSVELSEDFKSYGTGSIEEYLREQGLGVIHGGENSLRYTPHFEVTSEEVDLMVSATKEALLNGPKR